MEKCHDWRELSSVMAHYRIPPVRVAKLERAAKLERTAKLDAAELLDKLQEIEDKQQEFEDKQQEFEDKQKAWEALVNLLDVENVAQDADFAASIDTFIREHGDADIQLPNTLKRLWGNLLKGTGSPNKKQQRSRGSATIDRS